ARSGLDEVKIGGGALQIVGEKAGVMTVACGVEADADGNELSRRREGFVGVDADGARLRRRRRRLLGEHRLGCRIGVGRRQRFGRRGCWASLAWTRHDGVSVEAVEGASREKCVAASALRANFWHRGLL